jgi:hypothetical protein
MLGEWNGDALVAGMRRHLATSPIGIGYNEEVGGENVVLESLLGSLWF